MSIFDKMNMAFEIVTYDRKSSKIEIDELIRYSKINIPREFLDIIKERTEIEIWVNKEKYLRLWGAKGCIEMNDSYHIQHYITESLAIGDDECSNALLYAKGNFGFGLYIVALNDLDVDEMVYIADSLDSFLTNAEGINTFNNVW